MDIQKSIHELVKEQKLLMIKLRENTNKKEAILLLKKTCLISIKMDNSDNYKEEDVISDIEDTIEALCSIINHL